VMASQERRQRHRTRMRHAIIAGARDLFLANGVRNVSLRQIADRIEYSPATFYTYFGCKDDILLALADEDAVVLHQRISDATTDVVDPLVRIRRALWALYDFLDSNPLFVELMVLDSRHMKALLETLLAQLSTVPGEGHGSRARSAARRPATRGRA
jgi:AcrR family transcriptional regulator